MLVGRSISNWNMWKSGKVKRCSLNLCKMLKFSRKSKGVYEVSLNFRGQNSWTNIFKTQELKLYNK